MPSSAVPIRINNDDLVTLVQLKNSISATDRVISEADFEKQIAFNLSQNKTPTQVENSLVPNGSVSVVGNKELFQDIMISNNEDLIDSETVAIKMTYDTTTNTISDDPKAFSINGITEYITLLANGTQSYITSNLVMDLSYNNDLQNSLLLDSSSAAGDWKLSVDRSTSTVGNCNYFAAINSNLNTTNGSYPMSINKVSYPGLYNPTKYVSAINSTTKQATYSEFSSAKSLASNNINAVVDPNYNYKSEDFTMYKVVQPTPDVTQTIKRNGVDVFSSVLPIATTLYADIDVPTFSDFKTKIASLVNDISYVQDGFNINVVIGETNGYFDLSGGPNEVLNIDATNIVDSDSFVSTGLSKNTVVYLDVSNGSVDLSGTDTNASQSVHYNVESITLSDTTENLESSFNATNGKIQLSVESVDNRVDISGSNTLDASMVVIYNCEEAYANSVNSHIDLSMTINPYVNVNARVVVPTTVDTYLPVDSSYNLRKSNDAALVIANNPVNYNPSMPNYQDISFNSSINNSYGDDQIAFIKVTNRNILSEDTQLLDDTNTPVPNSKSAFRIQNIGSLEDLSYSDFQIRLNTKTLTDLSNSTHATNGWALVSDTEVLTSSPTKNSILYDDSLFMTSNFDSTFTYKVIVATTTITNAQSIKHKIDISFTDVIQDDNGDIRTVEAHAYLDNDDISYNDINYSEVEGTLPDASFNVLTGDSNPFELNKSNLRVSELTRTLTYRAKFDAKLPFYKNVNLFSPVITEVIHRYKVYDKNTGVELPDIYLKSLIHTNTNKILSLVTLNAVESDTTTTTLTVTRSNCSVLTGHLQGKKDGTFEDILNIASNDVDPFFNTSTNYYYMGSTTKVANSIVEVYTPTIIDKPYYTIDTTNTPGTNTSFQAKLFKYDTTNKDGTNNSFDNFNPYITTWATSPIDLSVNLDVSSNNNYLTLTIYDADGTTVLATIGQPETIINDFNIIYCINPLVKVLTTIKDLSGNDIMNEDSYTVATTTTYNGYSRKMRLTDGIFAYLTNSNPLRDQSVNFNLKSDQVKVQFADSNNVNNYGSNNNGWDTYHRFVDISGSPNSTTVFDCSSVKFTLLSGTAGNNVTRSVSFNKFRGYRRVGSGVDTIDIVRTPSVLTFVVQANSGNYKQVFQSFAANGVYTIDNAVNESDSSQLFDIGLKINGNLSLLNTDYPHPTRYYINIDGASIKWTLSNPGNAESQHVHYESSGNLLDASFNDLFGWKVRNILSDHYTINIRYNIPNIEIYNLDVSGSDVTGNPLNKSNWVVNSHSNFDLKTYTSNLSLSGIKLNRVQSYVPSDFTAYAVVIPPQLKITYNKSNGITSFPFNPASGGSVDYYITIVDRSVTEYSINDSLFPFTLIHNSIPSLQNYSTLKNEKIVILGNYLIIKYNFGSNSSRQPPDYVLFSDTIEKIYQNSSNYPYFDVSKNGVVYDIRYKQHIDGISNSTYNIHFKITSAFIPPYNSPPVVFNLPVNESTIVSFYQSNIRLIGNNYNLIIDKYTCPGIDYNSLIDRTDISLNELFFLATSHSTCTFTLNDTVSLTNINIDDLFSEVSTNQISFQPDLTFVNTNVGITLSALTSSGITKLTNLVKWRLTDYLLSKVSYINMPDIINVKSLFGSNVFRVTNSGNIRTPGVTSYAYNIVAPTALYDSSGSVMTNFSSGGYTYNNEGRVIKTLPNAP